VVFLYGGLTEPIQKGVATVLAERNGERRMWCADAAIKRFETELKAATSEENERLLYVALTRAGRRIYLPYFARVIVEKGKESEEIWEIPRLNGIYEKIAFRLNQLLASPNIMNTNDSVIFRNLAEIRVIPAAQLQLGALRSGSRTIPICEWKPPQNTEIILLEKEFAQIRDSQRAPGTSSYTKLKKMSEKVGRTGSDEVSQPWLDLPAKSATELPRGATFGVAVHECFQFLQWHKFGNILLSDFLAKPEVLSVIETALRRAGIALTHVGGVGEMVFNTLRAPLDLLGVSEVISCCSLREPGCEIAFCMPWPEPEHYGLESTFWPVKRGWLVGACDVIFEWRGRYFVLDWKTDTLPDYSIEECEKRFSEHYALQAKIYAVAACRLLGIGCAEDYEARFGGHVYMFVRGPRAISGRLSWQEVSAFERSLASSNGMTLSGGEA
jgi:ATP-dependent exoDNAse (exonuclease V) beta subunit